MKKIILTIVYSLSVFLLFAQNLNTQKLDELFETLAANNKFMCSVAISENGKIIYSNAFGYSDVENKIKPDINTKYRIGSISKTFTAVLILQAVEENKLQLNEKLEKFYPTIKNADKITIEQLLRHRTGIFSFTEDPDYLKWCVEKKTEKELIDLISKSESVFPPDSTYRYSNSNYVLLSFILEKIYKEPYSKLLQEKICEPAGLTNTIYGGVIKIENNEAYSYNYNGAWVKNIETDMSIPQGAGGIISTPTDLTKFIEALFDGKLISEESLEKMTALKDNYGFGIQPMPFYERRALGHNGAIDGFTSSVAYFSDDKIAFSYTSNGTNYNNNNIAIWVLSSIFGKPFEIPEFKTFEVTAEDLDKYLGVYSSKQIPLKITVTKNNNVLLIQATGQQQLAMEAIDENKFSFDRAGVVLTFNPDEESMVLKQGGEFLFTKEKTNVE